MKWINFGDISFAEYGGTQVRRLDENSYEYFHLAVSAEGDKFAFSGVVVPDFDDYTELLTSSAHEFGFKSMGEFVSCEPERAVAELIENYGCGVLEFSPRNYEGYGEYSMDYNDFRVSDEALEEFMKKVEL